MPKTTIALAVGLLALSSMARAAPPLYRVTDLGRIPHAKTMGILDLSRDGAVIGEAYRSGQNWVNWLWTPGTGLEVQPHPQVGHGHSVRPARFDDQGGLYFIQGEPRRRGVGPQLVHRFKDGSAVTLDATLSILTAANGNDMAIGTRYAEFQHAVSWNAAGAITDLNPPNFGSSEGRDVNDSGRMLINATNASAFQPIVLVPGAHDVKLEPLDKTVGASGIAMNAMGDVAGSSKVDSTFSVPVAWLGGTVPTRLTDGSPYSGFNGQASGIDDRGEVVGDVFQQSVYVTFWWSASDGMHALRDLIDPTDPFFGRLNAYFGPTHINGRGQIAFVSLVEGQGEHAFLLTPEE